MENQSSQSDIVKKLDYIAELLGHKAIDHTDIHRKVMYLLNNYSYDRTPYYFKIPFVYRASISTNENWFDDCIGKLYYPPTKVASLQRCNWEKEPVFYCSNDNVVPVFEVRAKVGDYVVISQWINGYSNGHYEEMPLNPLSLAVGVEELMNILNEKNSLRELLFSDDIYKGDMFSNISIIDKYMRNIFVKSKDEINNLYWLTSAFSKCIMENLVYDTPNSNIECMIYPSVESKLKGFNIVFSKKFADENLTLRGAAMYKVIDFDPVKTEYILQLLKGIKRVLPNCEPVWVKVHERHNNERFIFSPDTESTTYDPLRHLSYEDE